MSGWPIMGTNDGLRPPIRYRRFGGGYRREDVDLLLAELRLTLRALELELGTLREQSRTLEEQLRAARAEIDGHHAKGYELARVMSSVRERAERTEQEAEDRATALIAQAEAQAAQRIADGDASLRQLGAEKERLLSEITAILNRVGETIARESAAEPSPPAVSEPSAEAVENGFPGVGLSGLHEGLAISVELDAGPFTDFDSVADFERELGRLHDVEDVYVRRVKGERAMIELTVSRGMPLLARMREHLPYRLEVRDRSIDRLVVDVEAAEPARSE